MDDAPKWKAEQSGKYTVSSVYNWACSRMQTEVPYLKTMWKNIAPHRVQFFGWLIWNGRLKTSTFLQRIGVLDQHARLLCYFCGNHEETFDHVLLHCEFIWRIWAEVAKWWGFYWVMPSKVCVLLEWWWDSKYAGLEKELWNAIPLGVFWVIWKTRNDCCFNGAQANMEDMMEIIKVYVAQWFKFRFNKVPYAMYDFVYRLDLVRRCL